MKFVFDWIITLSNAGFSLLLSWSWHSALLIAGGYIGLKVARVQSPVFRHQIWLLCLIAAAFFPIWSLMVQSAPLPRPTSQILMNVADIPSTIARNEGRQLLGSPGHSHELSVVAKNGGSIPSSSRAFGYIFLAWAVGALALFIRIIQINRRHFRILGEARPTKLEDLDCNDSRGDLNGIERVRLLSHPRVNSPILVGFWRPSILLPADLSEWTNAAERKAMLQHEIAHLARWDHVINLFLCLLKIVFYFHPLMILACRQIEIEREMACDDRVINQGADAEIYAEGILKAAWRNATLQESIVLGIGSSKRLLEKRIGMIMSKDRQRYVINHRRKLALSIALILVAIWGMSPARSGLITRASYDSSTQKESDIYMASGFVGLTEEQKGQLKQASRRISEGLPPMRKINHEDFAKPSLDAQIRYLSSDGQYYMTTTRDSFMSGYLKNTSPLSSRLTFKTVGFDRPVTISLTEGQRREFSVTFHRSIAELTFEPTPEMESVFQSETGFRGAVVKLKNTIEPDAYLISFYSTPEEELNLSIRTSYRTHRLLGRDWHVHNLWSLFYPNLYSSKKDPSP